MIKGLQIAISWLVISEALIGKRRALSTRSL